MERQLKVSDCYGHSVTHYTKSVMTQYQSYKSMIPTQPPVKQNSRPQIKKKCKSIISEQQMKLKESLSIFTKPSGKGSMLLDALKFEDMPDEVLRLILMHCDDWKTWVDCLYVNEQFYKQAKLLVYSDPYFTSTYRVAQFVTSIRQHPNNAKLVHRLDFSHIESGLIEEDSAPTDIAFADAPEVALASWRDWRFKEDPLYGNPKLTTMAELTRLRSGSSLSLQRSISQESAVSPGKFKKIANMFSKKKKQVFPQQTVASEPKPLSYTPFVTKHPYTNKYFFKYASNKDLPVGYILHLLALCYNLGSIDFTGLLLASDYQIVKVEKRRPSLLLDEPEPRKEELIPLYVSDTSKQHFAWPQKHIRTVNEVDILCSLSMLSQLKSIVFDGVVWMKYIHVKYLIMGMPQLQYLSVKDSGMDRRAEWTISGSRANFKDMIEKVDHPPESDGTRSLHFLGRNYNAPVALVM